jgi:hypothetical protein
MRGSTGWRLSFFAVLILIVGSFLAAKSGHGLVLFGIEIFATRADDCGSTNKDTPTPIIRAGVSPPCSIVHHIPLPNSPGDPNTQTAKFSFMDQPPAVNSNTKVEFAYYTFDAPSISSAPFPQPAPQAAPAPNVDLLVQIPLDKAVLGQIYVLVATYDDGTADHKRVGSYIFQVQKL